MTEDLNADLCFITNPDVPYHFCRFDMQRFSQDLFNQHQIDLPHSIEKSVVKRQAEFFAGRYCGKRALENLTGRAQQIAIGSHRQPVWPEGIIGSVSHSSDLACAIVARSNLGSYVGIDIEEMIASDKVETIKDMIVCRQENDLISQSRLGAIKTLTLFFSAKETFFKAVFPHVNKYFDFLDARCTDLNIGDQTIEIRTLRDLSAAIPVGWTLIIKYQFYENQVITWVGD